VPLVPCTAGNAAALMSALADADPNVGLAAAASAGRMRLQEALPLLARLLRSASPEVSRAAAAALAQIPPRGPQVLREISGGSNAVAAAAAGEALLRFDHRGAA
jgi:HEAT repeat protein